MTQSPYSVEVYEPGSTQELLATWPLAAPLAVQLGDVLRLNVPQAEELAPEGLRVTRVEHFFFGAVTAPMKHKLMLFTEAVQAP